MQPPVATIAALVPFACSACLLFDGPSDYPSRDAGTTDGGAVLDAALDAILDAAPPSDASTEGGVGFPSPCTTTASSALLCDDFDEGQGTSNAKWDAPQLGGGTCVVDTSIAVSKPGSLLANVMAPSSNAYAYLDKRFEMAFPNTVHFEADYFLECASGQQIVYIGAEPKGSGAPSYELGLMMYSDHTAIGEDDSAAAYHEENVLPMAPLRDWFHVTLDVNYSMMQMVVSIGGPSVPVKLNPDLVSGAQDFEFGVGVVYVQFQTCITHVDNVLLLAQ